MIKKIGTMVACTLFIATTVSAAVSTPSATPQDAAGATTTPSAQQKLDNLKDRLASAATQLQQSQKRAIFGTVKSTSVSTITVETSTKDIKIELTDNIKVAQVIKGKRTDLTTDDISKDDTVVVFGDYDSNLDLLKAKIIFIQDALPSRIFGSITAVDKKDYTITVATSGAQSYVVDIETTTKNILWDKANGTAKGAFSKYAVGDTVSVLGTPNAKIVNRLSALRILDVGNLSGKASTPTPTQSVAASPSATLKVTPKPTVKPTATPTP
jgi:hypothetical protein